MNEPSLLDFIKAKIMPWKYSVSEEYLQTEVDENIKIINFEDSEVAHQNQPLRKQFLEFKNFRLLVALLFAIFGQSFLEPPDRKITFALIFYGIGFGFVIWEALSKESSFQYQTKDLSNPFSINISTKQIYLLLSSMVMLVLAFLAFRKNSADEILFNFLNLFLWSGSFLLFLLALLDFDSFSLRVKKWKLAWEKKEIFIKITPWLLLIILSTVFAYFFRFYRLEEVLGEMFSDHAEKLYDVYDVLTGKYPVFFIRNTGREFFQFYWTALIAIIFNTGISFMSLKLGTALAGFLTLPFIYLLGNELRNKWVGIIAFLFAGIAYWPNIISRVGLRFPLYPLFVAPTLYFLIRGIRQKRRNDFIYAGIALGFGLHGYSSTRFLPVVVLIAFIIFLIHKKSKGFRNQAINAFITLVIASFIIFLPLFKFTIAKPDVVGYRMMTRLTATERDFSEPPLNVFLDNFWKANTMFFYSNGGTWVHSIPNRPALDMITAGLYFLGTMIVAIQYLKFRNWEDIFLIIAVPLLMMPSILSLAFPDENPSLNRTGGAYIPVFILVAIGFEGVFRNIWRVAKSWRSKVVVISFGAILFLTSSMINYDLVFNQYDKQFMAGAWNTSQIGSVIKGFSNSIGNPDRAYVVPSPHWVDTRLVGINAGYPTKDYALWPAQFEQLLVDDGEKLVILKPDNHEALILLQEMFPNGVLNNYDSGYEGKDFYMFHIPPIIIHDEITNDS